MRDLTPRQRQILLLVQKAMHESGMPPHACGNRQDAEISLGQRGGRASAGARAQRGHRAFAGHVARHSSQRFVARANGLPLVGRVAAGQPILAEEHIEARYQIDPDLFKKPPHFLLRVHGMSMRDAGILDGDLVAVHRTPEVRARQIIVARLDNEVTVKRYRQEGHRVWLMPENPEFSPIQVDLREQTLAIEGVVVGVVRDSMK